MIYFYATSIFLKGNAGDVKYGAVFVTFIDRLNFTSVNESLSPILVKCIPSSLKEVGEIVSIFGGINVAFILDVL